MSGRTRWLFLYLASAVPLMGFWLYGLFDLDEGFYGAVVTEMNRKGEWITPFYNGKPWFEKPILIYWLTKPAVALFGVDWGPRLPSVLSTLGLYVLCGLYVRKRISNSAGMWSVVILSTSVLVVGLGRMLMTDAVLNLCIAGAFLSFYESLVGRQAWRLVTSFCLGLTVLAKGPFVLPLFIVLVAWTLVSECELRPNATRFWFAGTVILVATIAAWYVPAYLVDGSLFVQKFLVEQNLQRFGGHDEAHAVPIWLWPVYYPAVLLLGMLPWSIWVVKSWPRKDNPEEPSFTRYLARWAMVVVVFFTISGTKLPHYVLPAFAPLAMLIGVHFADRKLIFPAYATACAVLCGLANFGFCFWYTASGSQELHRSVKRINHMVKEPNSVIAYELARQGESPSRLGVNETSNPSIDFYLTNILVRFINVPDESKKDPPIEQLIQSARVSPQSWIITRPGRISAADRKLLKGFDHVSENDRAYSVYLRQSPTKK